LHRDAGARYRNRISGPLIDRIDMHVELVALPAEHLDEQRAAEGREFKRRSRGGWRPRKPLQMQRQGKLNARLSAAEVTSIAAAARFAGHLEAPPSRGWDYPRAPITAC
jgi:magnesium chelatase family protein